MPGLCYGFLCAAGITLHWKPADANRTVANDARTQYCRPVFRVRNGRNKRGSGRSPLRVDHSYTSTAARLFPNCEGNSERRWWTEELTNNSDVSPSACSLPNLLCLSLWQPLTFEAHLDTDTSTKPLRYAGGQFMQYPTENLIEIKN